MNRVFVSKKEKGLSGPIEVFSCVLIFAFLFVQSAHAAPVGGRFNPDDYASLGTYSQSSGNFAINTDTLFFGGSIQGATDVSEGGIECAVFCFDSLSLTGGSALSVTVTGSRPLVLLSKSDLTVDTILDVSGGDGGPVTIGVGVAGGGAGGQFDQNGNGIGAGRTTNNRGGGGAGYGGNGGNGGGANNRGSVYGYQDLSDYLASGGDLFGGSGGAGGGGDTNSSGRGAAGGGAIQIGAICRLTIGSDGQILADGGNGGTSTAGVSYGGGGGSGGSILLSAQMMVVDGVLSAVGGAGGNAAGWWFFSGYAGGGGGGGRIAVYANDLTFNGSSYVTAGAGGTITATPGTAGSAGQVGTYFEDVYDTSYPHVLTINRGTPAGQRTNQTSVEFTATFSEGVTGVGTSDFALTTVGVTGASITGVSGGPTAWSVSVNTGSGDGTIRLDLNDTNDSIYAVCGGDSLDPDTQTGDQTYIIDKSSPTCLVATTSSDPTNDNPIPFSFTFSEPMYGFVIGDISVTNGITQNFTGSDGDTVFSVQVVPATDGIVSCSVPAGRAADQAGNGNSASDTRSVTYDGTNPTVVVSTTSLDPTNDDPVVFSIQFSENVYGFAIGEITVVNGTRQNFTGSDGDQNYSVEVVPTADGTVSCSVGAGVADDESGNLNEASAVESVEYDSVSPDCDLSYAGPDPTNVNPIAVTIEFTEPVYGLIAGDFALVNCSVSALNFPDGATSGSVDVAPGGNGQLSVRIPSASANDEATNPNTGSNTILIDYDGTAPTVQVVNPNRGVTVNTLPTVSVTFTESVSGVAAGDLTVNSSPATGFSGSGAGPYVFSGYAAPGAGPVNVALAGGSIHDVASNSFAGDAWTYTIDTAAPVVLSENPSRGTSLITLPSIQATFSKTVVGVTAGDLTVNGSPATGLAGSGAGPYTFTGYANPADGQVNVEILAFAVSGIQDTVGNPFVGDAWTYSKDATAPVVSTVAVQSGLTVNVSFSEVMGAGVLDPANYALSGNGQGTLAGIPDSATQVSGNTYRLAWNTGEMFGGGDITITANNVYDVIGNIIGVPNSGTDAGGAIGVRPSCTMTYAGADPTNLDPINLSIWFSEPVFGLIPSDVAVSNGSVAALAFVDGATQGSVDVTPASDGVVTVQIPAGSATDTAGNENTISNLVSTTYDDTLPTCTVTYTGPDPTNSATITFDVEFSEDVYGLTPGEITITNGNVSALNFLDGDMSGSVDVTPTGNGTVSCQVPAGAAEDAATNGNQASGIASVGYDGTRPTVTVEQAAGQLDPTNSLPINFTVTFSESVTGLTELGVDVGGTAPGVTFNVGGSGTDWTIQVTSLGGNGTVVPLILADAAQDNAANGNQLSTSTDNSVRYDNTSPTVTLTSSAPNPTNSNPIPGRARFSEPVVGFESGDITPGNALLAGFTVVSATEYTFSLIPSGQGAVTADIAPGVATDLAGNPNQAAATLSRAYDSIQPTVTEVSPGTTGPTNLDDIPFTVVFSEDVTEFGSADVTVAHSGTTHGLVNVAQVTPATYTVTVSGVAGNGTFTISIIAGAAQDAAQNASTAGGPSAAVTIDNTQPTLVLSSTAANPTNSAPIPARAVFSEAVAGFDINDVSPTNAIVAGFTVVSATEYTFDMTPLAEGVVSALVAGGAAHDGAGNGNVAGNVVSRTYDSIAPTVSSVVPPRGATRNDLPSVSVTFTESVVGVTPDIMTVDGSAATNVTGSGAGPYVFTGYADPGNGPAAVALDGGAVEDTASNPFAGDSWSYSIDNQVPVIALVDPEKEASVQSLPSIEVTFSKPVTGVAAGDLAVQGSAATGVTGSDAGPYVFTGYVAPGPGAVTVEFQPGSIQDLIGNPFPGDAWTYDLDLTGPEATSIVRAGASPTNSATVEFTVTFSEPVTGVVAGEFIPEASGVLGASIDLVTGSDDVRTVSVLTGAGDGTLSIDLVPGGAITDEAGNPLVSGFDAGETYTIDKTAPVIVSIIPFDAGPTNAESIDFAVSFSEEVSGLTGAGVVVDHHGTAHSSVVIAQATADLYLLTVAGITGDGTFTVSISPGAVIDSAGNGNAANGPSDAVTIDNSIPTILSVVPDEAGPTNRDQIVFSVTFSEAVSGFTGDDVTVFEAGTTHTIVTVQTISGLLHNVTVSGITGDGTLSIAVNEDAAYDAGGNGNVAGEPSAEVQIDNTPPECLSVSMLDPSPTTALNVAFEVVFSEPVTDFSALSCSISETGGLYGSEVSELSGFGDVYTVTISRESGYGMLGLNILANGTILDYAGNTIAAGRSCDELYQFVPSTMPTAVGDWEAYE